MNDGHGGPYNPSGLRMVDALADVQDSLSRIASSGKTGEAFSLLNRLKGFIDRGITEHSVSRSGGCPFLSLQSDAGLAHAKHRP